MADDLFKLSAVLGLDTSEYEAGLFGAKTLANKTLGGIKGFVLKEVKQLALQAVKEIPRAAIGFAKNVVSHGLALDESLGAVYALTDAEDELAKKTFELTVLEEARQSIFDASEVAEGGMYEALAGYDFEDVTKGLHGLIVTAEAAGEPLKPVSDILTDLITAFGEEAEEQMHYGDVLAATATNTNTTILKMGDTFKYVSPVAAALGYDIEDVAIGVGMLADQAIKGSQAGTTLRSVLQRLGANTSGARDLLTAKLGVNFLDEYNNARPFLEFLTDAREAWHGLSEAERDAALNSFMEDANYNIDEADEVLNDFKKDVIEMQRLGEEFEDAIADDKDFVNLMMAELAKPYKKLFEELGMSSNYLQAYGEEYVDLMDMASAKLSVLNDEQKISWANRIGGLRAMAGWLALMNMEEDKYQETIESIKNNEGAAEKMRDKRYDNLYGDIVHFNAALDVLYDKFYFEWRSPLRDLVQAATTSINEIGDTYIAEGWNAAVDKAFSSLTMLWEQYAKPITDKLGPAIGNAIIKGLDWLNTEGGKVISDIAATFVGGLWDGIVTKIKGESIIGHGGLVDTLTFGLAGKVASVFGYDLNSHGEEYELGTTPEGAIGYVEKEADGKTSSGGTAEYIVSNIADAATSVLDRLYGKYGVSLADAGDEAGYTSGGGAPRDKWTIGLAPVDSEEFKRATAEYEQYIANAGADGGAQMAQAVVDNATSAASLLYSAWTQDSTEAGVAIGQGLSSGIQSELDATTFTVNVVGNYVGTNNAPGGAAPWQQEKFAKGMSGGYIMRGATIFGENAKGQPMVGGEAGNEAIVGTGSLNRMIQSSVNAAMNGLLNRLDAMVERMVGYEPRVYLDTGALVGGMVNGINSELNDITRWRGSGRT